MVVGDDRETIDNLVAGALAILIDSYVRTVALRVALERLLLKVHGGCGDVLYGVQAADGLI